MSRLPEPVVRAAVLEVLSRITLRPEGEIRLEHDLIDDLRIDSDDLSFGMVLGLEHRFGVRTTQEDWNNVHTVADVIQVFAHGGR